MARPEQKSKATSTQVESHPRKCMARDWIIIWQDKPRLDAIGKD